MVEMVQFYNPQIASEIFLSHSLKLFGFESPALSRCNNNQVAYRIIVSAMRAPKITIATSIMLENPAMRAIKLA
jgi:hypothetical protein